MHGFNTFEIDTFQYPNLCSRCAESEPAATWQLVHSTIEFPDGMPTGIGNERRNYNDYVARVPVCDKCLGELKKGSRLCWLVGAVAGAVAAFYVVDYMLDAGIKVQGAYLTAAAAGGVITLVLGWILKAIALDGCGFASLDGLTPAIKFKNKEYQELFDTHNPKAWTPSTGSAAQPAAGARGW